MKFSVSSSNLPIVLGNNICKAKALKKEKKKNIPISLCPHSPQHNFFHCSIFFFEFFTKYCFNHCQKYEMVTHSIDSSLAALIHPNSTTMRRCFSANTLPNLCHFNCYLLCLCLVSVHIIIFSSISISIMIVIIITTINMYCIVHVMQVH